MAVQALFKDGVKYFEAKDFSQALDQFNQALDLEPNNVTLLVNKALTHYELGQKLEAYAHFKKALMLSPDSEAARQGFEFVAQQVQVKEIPHQIELVEQARALLVTPFEFSTPLAFLFILFVLTGVFWIRNVSQKKKAFLRGEDAEPIGTAGWFSSILFIVCSIWTAFFAWDSSQPRGLIKKETLALHSAPDVNSPTILELNGGLEVRILRKQKGWIQVQFPGSFSGWAEKDSVLEL